MIQDFDNEGVGDGDDYPRQREPNLCKISEISKYLF